MLFLSEVKIVSDHTDILSLKYKSYEKKEFTSKSLEIDVAKINSVLGTNLSKSKYLDLLQSNL